MAATFTLRWDAQRPVLREVLGPELWTEQDDSLYMAALLEVLRNAPENGFDFVSDARAYTMQSERPNDEDIYDIMVRAGCRRLIQVGAKTVVSMQTARVLRTSAADDMMHITCGTLDEAEALLR